METINGVPKEVTLSLTQTAKGVIYIDKVSISGNTEQDVLDRMEKLMKDILNKISMMNGWGDKNGI